ncbi:MAG: endonuclease [Oligoflexia bacterium]|nr:endonuclease [Oligoflexia bacterium]MBF0364445.1 endonuclease [Oligoflexia bacterium]
MKKILLLMVLFSLWSMGEIAASQGNQKIDNFGEAKKIINAIHKEHPYTIYCNCRYQGNKIDLKSCGYKVQKDARRAYRLEWEHVVPAEAFGKSFKEWREGSGECMKKGKQFKGRKCAGKNPEFAKMEADLYNLWPEIGELNGLRSNFSMAEIGRSISSERDFGDCKAKLMQKKFEPMDFAKGIVARTYMYMDKVYPGRGIISDKNQKLFEAWDKQYPAGAWECKRAEKIAKAQGNVNEILKERCLAIQTQQK